MKFNIYPISREQFVKEQLQSDPKLDSFARTFIRKADMQNLWDNCKGIIINVGDEDFEPEKLVSAIITTHSKKEPKIANLQLLHTFSKYRKMQWGTHLCLNSLFEAWEDKCSYYRVSAEPSAVKFYENVGFKFLGKQKSGSQLSMFKIHDYLFANAEYDINDPIIQAAVYKKGKGGCIEIF